MAYASSLRIRKSLVWETKIPEIWNWSISPTFSLMNSEWTLFMHNCRDSSDSYEIILERKTYTQSFHPFQVITFLEDRRSNCQMYCSTLIVSSISEILYKASFDSLLKDFPGFKIYGDLAVICLFCPSTELTLSGGTEKGSTLSIRQSLVWKTRIPIAEKQSESPVFTLMKSSWQLGLQTSAGTQSSPAIWKISLRSTGSVQSFEPFEVKTFLEDERNDVQIYCSRLTVSTNCETLYKESLGSIHERLPALKFYDDINVICIFRPNAGLSLCEKQELVQQQKDYFIPSPKD